MRSGMRWRLKWGVFLEQLPVLRQQRPAWTGTQAVLVVTDRYAGFGGLGLGFISHESSCGYGFRDHPPAW